MIAALVTAFSGHWIVLQSVAWTAMILDNTRRSEWRDAFAKTFDGRHPCPLCKSIEKGRQSEKKRDAQVVASKLNLFHQAHAVALSPPHDFRQLQTPDTFSQRLPHRPPVPPPRDFPG